MSKCKKKTPNGAVEQIIGNMTSDIQSADGQYIQLGFTPPPTPVDNTAWNQTQPNPYLIQFPGAEPKIGYPVEEFNQGHYGYVPQVYNNFEGYHNGSSDMFDQDYNFFAGQTHNAAPESHLPNNTQLIENLMGNWTVPNASGTYSPFGNAQFVPNINLFESQAEADTYNSNGVLEEDEDAGFQFRDSKKPRVVAEVKPMRPSYSDVLTKSAPVPTVKLSKVDNKENKQKKDSKKGSKNEKNSKLAGTLNRSNTTNDVKENLTEKCTPTTKSNIKISKNVKTNQLNRKWVSLDNVAEGSSVESKVELQQKNKKNDEINNINKSLNKTAKKTAKSNVADNTDTDSGNNKTESFTFNKNAIKKVGKGSRQKSYDSFGSSDRPPGKRGQRVRKRENHVPFGIVGQKCKQYLRSWWKIFISVLVWLINLIYDICSLSAHLSHDMACLLWTWLKIHGAHGLDTTVLVMKRIRFFTWIWEKVRRKKDIEETNKAFLHTGLQTNINMPTTGEEAMKRLLACKGKDPYSILGVTPSCTDDDIKRYYKRQAFLVHPDKNQQPGAEEAFKILVHAFDMIGEPERRASYDRGVAESAQVEQAWSELTELLAQLQQKVEAAANTIRCSACSQRHKRIKVNRPIYAARNCTSCKIHHSAREGDIWAEARCFGFLWHYYACMDGGVYDITEWAGCQKDSLKHLRPDSHHVQYRIALGKQGSQQRRHSGSPRSERPPDLENLLNSLYGQQDAKRRNKKSNK